MKKRVKLAMVKKIKKPPTPPTNTRKKYMETRINSSHLLACSLELLL
jgi:hypothetical protein